MKSNPLSVFLLSTSVVALLPNLGLGTGEPLTINPGTLSNHHIISWWGEADQSYSIQYSLDLNDWNFLPVIEDGRNETIEYGIHAEGQKVFVRLAFSEDADRLADNWEEEFQLNLLPDSEVEFSDTDGDGYLNVFEFFKDSDPVTNANRPASDINIGSASATIQMGIDVATTDYFVLEVDSGPWTGSGNEELVLNSQYPNFHLSAPGGGIETVQIADGFILSPESASAFIHTGTELISVSVPLPKSSSN